MTSHHFDDYLSIEGLESGVRERTMRGGVYTLTAQACKIVLQLVSTLVLARLLSPEDFGLVTMVTVVTGFAEVVKDLGLSAATIQRERLTHRQLSTLFWINTGLGAALMLAIVAIAPLLARFYGRPQIVGIAIALSFCQLVGGIGMQYWALLKRKMRFGALAMLEVAAWTVAISFAVVLALLKKHYWALVGMHLGYHFTFALGAIFLSPWRPGLPSRGVGARSFLSFGKNVAGHQLATYFSRNTDNLLIGWRWGEAAVGYYAKAYNLLMLPLRQINYPLGDVMIPGLSRVQNDPARFRDLYLEALFFITFVTFPITAALVVAAHEVVLLMLGPQWIPSILMFQLLGLAAFVESPMYTVLWLCVSRGRTKTLLRWGLFSTSCTVVAFVCGLPWGANGVAFAYSLTMLALAVPALFIATRDTAIRMADVVRCVGPSLTGSLFAAAGAWGVERFCAPRLGIGLTLTSTLVTMGAIYIVTVFFAFKKKAVFVSVSKELLGGWSGRGK